MHVRMGMTVFYVGLLAHYIMLGLLCVCVCVCLRV